MKHPILFILFIGILQVVQLDAQTIILERAIMVTDTIEDEGVTFPASSDDAEQENDEIDALYDDDIDAGWEGDDGDANVLTAGLRFRNIDIPQGAIIESVYIEVVSHEAKTADDVALLTIVCEATDDAQTFTEDALITDRPRTTAQVNWTVDVPWGLWSTERTPDLRSIVQEVVDRPGWEAGNSLAFILLGTNEQGPSDFENAREFESFENISDPEDGGDGMNYPDRVPKVIIEYSIPSTVPAGNVVDVRIIATDTITDEGVTFPASSDDAEQENDEIDALFDDDIDAGWEGDDGDANVLTAGLRFQNIEIPQGAIIDSAFLEVVSHEAKTAEDVALLTIVCEATDNAETFTEDALITDRPRTVAQINWTVDEPWGLWSTERTPDLSGIIQEIVDRPGWEFGNSLALLLLGTNEQGPSDFENAREFESFENISDPEDGGDGMNYPDRVPRLLVYYSMPAPTQNLIDVRIVATDTITDDGVTFPASSDDAEQENDEIDALYDDDIDAGWEGNDGDANVLTAGMRFQNIGIPQGYMIDSAFIEVVSHEAKTAADVALLTIHCEATDNAETFTEDALITDRPRTASSVDWTVDEEWGLWSTERTPDLRDIVQEVIDRPGWETGNALSFIFLGTNEQGPSDFENAREWESFENISDPEDGGDGMNYPDRVPRLLIYFSEGDVTSVEDLFKDQVEDLKVFPNPAQDMITIELQSDEAAIIELFTIDGRFIKGVRSTFGQQHQLSLEGIPMGTYMVRALQGQKVYAQRVIVN